MRLLNPLEYLTVRTGKLVAEKLEQKDVHPFDWDWRNGDMAFGLGTRGFTTVINGIHHEARISWDNVYKLGDYKKPKKIKAEVSGSHYGKKYCCINSISKHGIDLKNVYKLLFVDDKTGLKFFVSNLEILHFKQPEESCKAYFDFNPYAVFGTGFKDWSNPYYVDVLQGEYGRCTRHEESDLFDSMHRAIENKDRHLADLTNYTKLKF